MARPAPSTGSVGRIGPTYLYGVLLRDNVCFMCLLCFSRLVLSWEVRPRKAIWKWRWEGTWKTPPHRGSSLLATHHRTLANIQFSPKGNITWTANQWSRWGQGQSSSKQDAYVNLVAGHFFFFNCLTFINLQESRVHWLSREMIALVIQAVAYGHV